MCGGSFETPCPPKPQMIGLGNLNLMNQSILEACSGVEAEDGGPFGAIVVRTDGNQVVAKGHNMVLRTNDPTAHAEVTAIRNAAAILGKFDLSGYSLYTSCYPCPMCMGACLWARFDHIYYAASAEQAAAAGFDDKAFHDFLKDPKSDNIRTLEHLEVDSVLLPFKLWNAKPIKTPY
ncbi:unnamed protein product [Caenorhabditis angaria]|uniref:CMP/dCMP-type deaminase domain-containing protein n=1 Tax=Caenorhabditis angaria TaxID=860376 RepID=A0A9P1IHV8_9PELO|nr:unnamed protein product [Caenorhabditis angaria]